MDSDWEYSMHESEKQSTTSRMKAWWTNLLREQTDLIKQVKASSDKTLAETLQNGKVLEQVWKTSQENDEGRRILKAGGWKLFKRVIGTILKDGEDLIK